MNTSKRSFALADLRGRAVISVDEVACLLGIGRSSAYEAVHRHEIPALRVGGRLLVPVGQLLTLLGLEETEDDLN